MDEKTPLEFVGVHRHGLRFLAVFAAVIFPLARRSAVKRHHAVFEREQQMVGYGHPMSVTAEVFESPLRAAERRFGVDHRNFQNALKQLVALQSQRKSEPRTAPSCDRAPALFVVPETPEESSESSPTPTSDIADIAMPPLKPQMVSLRNSGPLSPVAQNDLDIPDNPPIAA
jgi:hypothetical protein